MIEQPPSRQDWIIIISVCLVVIFIIIILVTLACVYFIRRFKAKQDKALQVKTGTPEKEISPNQTFYENLPFKGLKRPPTQVISRDSCDYADCEYADYADGPLQYHATSKLQAEGRRVEDEEKQP
eukprot:TRINITY_DN32891_c0_g1_i1.p1 TRINITY_DN32891_c0_g1~~TRINITY_DN32891_c0_g1_i1.p1  ORF type:complete len:125 (+),score=31.89 TRINITY_DN32891_c0_g1_i1:112-486(+)